MPVGSLAVPRKLVSAPARTRVREGVMIFVTGARRLSTNEAVAPAVRFACSMVCWLSPPPSNTLISAWPLVSLVPWSLSLRPLGGLPDRDRERPSREVERAARRELRIGGILGIDERARAGNLVDDLTVRQEPGAAAVTVVNQHPVGTARRATRKAPHDQRHARVGVGGWDGYYGLLVPDQRLQASKRRRAPEAEATQRNPADGSQLTRTVSVFDVRWPCGSVAVTMIRKRPRLRNVTWMLSPVVERRPRTAEGKFHRISLFDGSANPSAPPLRSSTRRPARIRRGTTGRSVGDEKSPNTAATVCGGPATESSTSTSPPASTAIDVRLGTS